MSLEALEKAFLKNLTGDGDLVQPHYYSQAELDALPDGKKAQALANLAAATLSQFHPDFKEVFGEELESEYHQTALKTLIGAGWDGQTVQDFNRDMAALKKALKTRLSPKDWQTYFG